MRKLFIAAALCLSTTTTPVIAEEQYEWAEVDRTSAWYAHSKWRLVDTKVYIQESVGSIVEVTWWRSGWFGGAYAKCIVIGKRGVNGDVETCEQTFSQKRLKELTDSAE